MSPADPGPDKVISKSDHARTKIHPTLRKQLDAGSTKEIRVFVTVSGDPSAVEALLADAHVAKSGDVALVVGKIHAQALTKLAGARGVVSVNPIEFKQTGKPLGSPDPEVGKRPTAEALDKALRGLYEDEVPYSEAPPLAGSNFEALKDLALLDAKTHKFAEAWEAGYTGTGTTVGVLDGGTDFGHPDLIGTWQVWSGLTGVRAGWNGWPKAFDPFGTLQWLAAPSQIDQGLSWYVRTTAVTCKDHASKARPVDLPGQVLDQDRSVAQLRRPDRHQPAQLPVRGRHSRSPATSASAATRTTTCSRSSASGRPSS